MSQNSCANPLLLEWVKEWWDEARERSSKGAIIYKHAYQSLKACPITYEHPSSLQQLKGWGPKLCDRLTDKLKAHCDENGLPMPEHPSLKKRPSKAAANDDNEDDDGDKRPAKKPRKTKPPKQYVPAYRSGPYALVLALSSLDPDAPMGMTKAELIEEAQPHCTTSFTAPSDPGKFYTAWNSMKTLVTKELVYEHGRPLKRYALTDEGWEVAKAIRKAAKGDGTGAGLGASTTTRTAAMDAETELSGPSRPAVLVLDDDVPLPVQSEFRDVVADGKAGSDDSALPSFTPTVLQPGSFTVQLVLDVREIRTKTDRDYMQQELAKKGVTPIMRSLELGDCMWVAKCNDPDWLSRHGGEGDEVVLNWIVERKRLDDLIGSVKDGRYHEQKSRLKRSGVRNVIYLVEEITLDSMHDDKTKELVQSALATTQVVNGYFLKKTKNMDDSVRYLARLTNLLRKMHESKPLRLIPTKVLTTKNYLPLFDHLRKTQPGTSHHISYQAFASLVSKTGQMTLRDQFLKMLMCTKGVTGEKAMEIQKRWKTPYDFVKAYEKCGSDSSTDTKKAKASLVSSQMSSLIGNKKIALTLSKTIAEVWGDL